MKRIWMIMCAMTAAFSFLMVCFAAGELITGKAEDTGMVIGLLLIFGCIGFAAGRYVIISRSIIKKQKEQRRERKLLSLIKKKGGRITAFELAAESELSLEEAQNFLEDMCERGAGQVHLTPQGSSLYVFAGVISEQEKKHAKSPIEL